MNAKSLRRVLPVVALVSGFSLVSCATYTAPDDYMRTSSKGPRLARNEVNFKGTVVRRGGASTPVYYGIISDSGGRYVPTNLPPTYRRNGARVVVTGRTTGAYTPYGWGVPLRIYDIVGSRAVVVY